MWSLNRWYVLSFAGIAQGYKKKTLGNKNKTISFWLDRFPPSSSQICVLETASFFFKVRSISFLAPNSLAINLNCILVREWGTSGWLKTCRRNFSKDAKKQKEKRDNEIFIFLGWGKNFANGLLFCFIFSSWKNWESFFQLLLHF